MLRTGNIDTGPLLQAMMNERGASRHQQPSGTGGLPPNSTPLVSALMPQQQGAPTLPPGNNPADYSHDEPNADGHYPANEPSRSGKRMTDTRRGNTNPDAGSHAERRFKPQGARWR